MTDRNAPKPQVEATEPGREDAIAVALAYDIEQDNAPRVVAGGRGCIAEQILSIADAQGIEVRRDADLAQVLAAVDIDSEIPVEAFIAVAEILAYVYRANGSLRPEGETHTTPGDPLP